MECTEFHSVLDRCISRQDANREVLPDFFDPTALANRPEPERHGFVEAFCGDLSRVLDSFGIADRDAAGADGHRRRVAYSPYIRYHSRTGAVMRDVDYVVELARAYGCAVISRDELQNEIHSCSLDKVMFGVNAFAEEFGDEAAAAFVVAAELPILWERVFTPAELAADEEARPEGCWSIDRGDERV